MKKLLALLMAVLMVLSTSAALGESLLPLKEPVKITMAITQNANVSDYENNYFTKWLEEKTGINTMIAEDPLTAVAIGTGKCIEYSNAPKKGLLD